MGGGSKSLIYNFAYITEKVKLKPMEVKKRNLTFKKNWIALETTKALLKSFLKINSH